MGEILLAVGCDGYYLPNVIRFFEKDNRPIHAHCVIIALKFDFDGLAGNRCRNSRSIQQRRYVRGFWLPGNLQICGGQDSSVGEEDSKRLFDRNAGRVKAIADHQAAQGPVGKRKLRADRMVFEDVVASRVGQCHAIVRRSRLAPAITARAEINAEQATFLAPGIRTQRKPIRLLQLRRRRRLICSPVKRVRPSR